MSDEAFNAFALGVLVGALIVAGVAMLLNRIDRRS